MKTDIYKNNVNSCRLPFGTKIHPSSTFRSQKRCKIWHSCGTPGADEVGIPGTEGRSPDKTKKQF